MSHAGDAARDRRHREKGGIRTHLRIGRDAAEALDILCDALGLTRRQVIERLLLEAAPAAQDSIRDRVRRVKEDALMAEFHVSREQARDAIERGQV